MNLRHFAFASAFKAISVTHAHRWARGLAQGLGAILMLHSVRPRQGDGFAPNQALEITPEWLDEALALVRSEGYDLVDMDEMAARIAGPRRDRFAVALTFDDGFRDNRDHALPVLRRHRAPWTMHVTTGFADGHAALWWVELEEAIRALPRVTLTVAGRIIDHETRDAETRQAAFDEVYWSLRGRPEAELRNAIAALGATAGLDSARLTRALCLDWDELRALAAEPGLTIGAHTKTHVMLARHPVHVAQPEIVEARDRIAFELGVPVHHMAYPVGDATSAGPREFAIARDAGFRTAVTTRPGHVFAGHASHLHALPRVSLNGYHQNADALKALLSGLPMMGLNWGRRLQVT
ncbi:MAG: polysaccharide deacetylase family protein [Beijerinckiaceae bacterium]|nr:polysaccharide deacetylase family protein [Beijerinckiaceae bacterium]